MFKTSYNSLCSALLVLLSFCLCTTAQGQNFNAIGFTNNTDYVSTTFNPAFGANQDFSIEFRIKTNGWAGDPAIVSDKDWDSGFNEGFNIALGNNGTGIDVNVGDGNNRADLLAGTINDNEWHHVLVTFDRSGDVSLYIDGVLAQATSMANVGNIDSPYDFNIGQDGTSIYGPAAQCSVSEIKVWNKVLPLNEIERCGSIDNTHPSWNDLLHYYKCDEGSGTLVADSKGNNDGTAQGGFTWNTGNNFTNGCSGGNCVYGACKAVNFDGNNDGIIVANNPALRPADEVTVESWIYARSFAQWESILSHAQDNGGNESGYDFAYVNDQLRFRLTTTTMGGNEWDGNPGIDNFPFNKWVHVAGTYDGSTVSIYLNGILVSSQNKTGPIDWQYLPEDLRIGAFHDDNEDYHFDGKMDEVRIWNYARTENEIRQTMCAKLTGNEGGLIAYWRLDEGSGNIVQDLSPTAANGLFDNMNPATAWQESGAALGDVSDFEYTNNWQGQSVGLTSAYGSYTVNPAAGQVPQGIHVYRVDNLPASTNGVPDLLDNNVYWGAYVVADDNNDACEVTYNYSNYGTAINNNNIIDLYGRVSNEGQVWSIQTNGQLPLASEIYADFQAQTESVVGFQTAIPCPAPTDLDTSNVTGTSALLSWNANGGSTFNIQYGQAGFILGAGVVINNIINTSFNLTNLSGASDYQFYVQTVCANGTSTWVGPFNFQTFDPCPLPSNLVLIDLGSNFATIGWTSINNNFDVQWGPAGFTFGLGIVTSNVTNPHTFNSLPANYSYDVYVRANCDPLFSDWIGPITFTTAVVGVAETNVQTSYLAAFPNPASGELNCLVNGAADGTATWRIVDMKGVAFLHGEFDVVNGYAAELLDLNNTPSGIYLLELNDAKGNRSYTRIAVQ